jgi:glycerol kinase
MKYILALDQGTTSSRALLFDRSGSVIASAQQEFRQIFPRPGWVEHDPEDIWQSQRDTMLAVCRQAGITGKDIAAIGITNQRETTLIWDRKTGEPIHNAIVWQDRRTAPICDKLQSDGHGPLIARRSGLIIDAYFAGTKIQWLLKNVKGARKRARNGDLAFGTVDSWLLWKLTEGQHHLTDASNASRTMLYNIKRGAWDPQLLELLQVPEAILPEVRSCSEIYGETSMLGHAVPIAGIAGDQQAALFGQACHQPGMVKNTYGTGCFMLMHTGTQPVRSRNRLVTTIAWRIGDRPNTHLEGSIFIGGAVTQWLRDGLGLIRESAEIESLASRVPDNGGVYFVPAFSGLGAPHWNPYARGTITGLTRGTTSGHLARAALEGIAYQVADVLEAMQKDSGLRLKQLRVDGGACANNLLMQFQADLLRVPVVRPVVQETTALGAAYLAGLAVGYWKSRDDIARQWQMETTFKPTMKLAEARKLNQGWQQALASVSTIPE